MHPEYSFIVPSPAHVAEWIEVMQEQGNLHRVCLYLLGSERCGYKQSLWLLRCQADGEPASLSHTAQGEAYTLQVLCGSGRMGWVLSSRYFSGVVVLSGVAALSFGTSVLVAAFLSSDTVLSTLLNRYFEQSIVSKSWISLLDPARLTYRWPSPVTDPVDGAV